MNITLHQIQTFAAVVEQGSFQAGARYLHKTHPSVISALNKLEAELGFALFDRSGYRTSSTEQGRAFYQRCKKVLHEVGDLKTLAQYLQEDRETEITIAIGDVSPLAPVLKQLRNFSVKNKSTHLNLLFENLEGANERLFAGDAHLIVHHIDKSDVRYDYKNFCSVKVVPVVAAEFLAFTKVDDLRYQDLEKYTQCIIRSTATSIASKDHFILDQSAAITVGDQYTKKEIILQGMAWGHMPHFLVESELKSGALVSIEGNYIKGNTLGIVIARLQKHHYGPMETILWEMFD